MSAGVSGLTAALSHVGVLETGDERGEFAGLLIASLGAAVTKLEPLNGSPSRRTGPFASSARDPEQSLCFWRYNLDKRSVTLDLAHEAAPRILERLATSADVIIDAGAAAAVERRLSLYRAFAERNPELIVCTITPFGLDGPYRDFKATDLTQLALGGVMAVCGYDARPDGVWETPPIAPGMWQSNHLAGEYAALSITAALNFRDLGGGGQFIDVSIHEAVNSCTELAIPTYIYAGAVVKRQTARHAAPVATPPWLHRSADGGYVNATVTPFEREFRALVSLLDEAGIKHDLLENWNDQKKRSSSVGQAHVNSLIDELVAALPAEEVFHRAQAKGIGWAYVRRPEQNLDDEHFKARGSFAPIAHPELGRELRYPASVATDGQNRVMGPKRRAPRLGADTREVLRAAGFTSAEIEAFAAAGAI